MHLNWKLHETLINISVQINEWFAIHTVHYYKSQTNNIHAWGLFRARKSITTNRRALKQSKNGAHQNIREWEFNWKEKQNAAKFNYIIIGLLFNGALGFSIRLFRYSFFISSSACKQAHSGGVYVSEYDFLREMHALNFVGFNGVVCWLHQWIVNG